MSGRVAGGRALCLVRNARNRLNCLPLRSLRPDAIEELVRADEQLAASHGGLSNLRFRQTLPDLILHEFFRSQSN